MSDQTPETPVEETQAPVEETPAAEAPAEAPAEEAPVSQQADADAAAAARVDEPTDLAQSVQLPAVSAPENAQVGDENISPPFEMEIEVNDTPVPAQVTGPPSVVVTEQPVHEVHVKLDRVITDPSSPEAVQIPDAGRGDASLPIHDLDRGTVEDFFREHAS